MDLFQNLYKLFKIINIMNKNTKKELKEIKRLSNGIINKDFEKAGNEVGKALSSLVPFSQYGKKSRLTIGQRAADGLTKWAGSWFFILLFFLFLIIWMAINGYFLIQYHKEVFDPYPFILLNLVLSCLAAIQAPVILMSQNRVTQRDRLRAEYDYKVNRKAEKEIREIKTQLDKIERNLK